jgi:predicted Zn-dependent peptidase
MQLHTYNDGMKLLLQPKQHVESATIMVVVGAGSRYETKEMSGISHFLEHMFFKGSEKYPTPHDVASNIDAMGAECNAFTGKEIVAYYIRCDATKIQKAISLLSDMMMHAKCNEQEINHERGVILEEYNMYQDTPMYQISWDFEKLVFGDQPLGWDQIGTKEYISSVTRDELMEYRNKLYTAPNVLISIAGNIDPESIKKSVESEFQLSSQKIITPLPYQKISRQNNISIHNKSTEQTHLHLGFEALSKQDSDYTASKVLASLLGGNMSSRMFQNIREKKGLCYYIRTENDGYKDTGLFYTRAGVQTEKTTDAVESILKEYQNILENPLDEKELSKVKSYLCGKLSLQLESTEFLAENMGIEAFLYPENIMDYKAKKEQIHAITTQDLRNVAEKIFTKENLCLSVIGPVEKYKDTCTKLLQSYS